MMFRLYEVKTCSNRLCAYELKLLCIVYIGKLQLVGVAMDAWCK